MKRDVPRVPASRRSARGRFAQKRPSLPLLLTILAALAVAFAPGCGSTRATGDRERTGTTSQALTAGQTLHATLSNFTFETPGWTATGSFDYDPATSTITNVAVTLTLTGNNPSSVFLGDTADSSISFTSFPPPDQSFYAFNLVQQHTSIPCNPNGNSCASAVLQLDFATIPTTPGTYYPGCAPYPGCGGAAWPSILQWPFYSGGGTGYNGENQKGGSLIITAGSKTLGKDCAGQASCGDPINVSSGNVFEQFTDYETAGQNKLSFIRYYNSFGASVPTFATSLGNNWRTNYDRYIRIVSSSSVRVERADGRQVTFALSGGAWTTDTDVDMTLTNSGSTWTLTDSDDTVETYTTTSGGNEALLNSITARNGYTQTLAYSGTQLNSVTDSYSRSLTFGYSSGTLFSVTNPEGTHATYAVASTGNGNTLIEVVYPTSPSSFVVYTYGNSTFPYALTSITDENGNTFSSWTYDAQGRGTSSQLGTGANLTTLAYNADGTTSVTNALGVTDTYSFTTLQGLPKITGISRASTSTTAAATESLTYDGNGYLASKTDWNGNQTTYVNNSHGLPTTINEAVGTSVARTTTIVYDSAFPHLPDSITTPGATASFTYDGSGNQLTETLTDTTTTSTPYSTNGQTRTRTKTWSNHLLATTKTPNGNVTTYGYGSDGTLTSVTNALSQVTSVTSHTGGGRPLTVVDPNGVTTTLTYDPRQRLTSSAVTMSAGVRTTTYAYDKAGNLTQTTLPDSSSIANTFDTAHRLTKVTDAIGNYTTYTLDALGDRTATNVYHSYAALYAMHSDTFDALGRVLVDTGGRGQTVTRSYDANGNVLTVKDGFGHTTTNTYDALNRRSTVTDRNSGMVTNSYDAHDRITAVQDALGHSTSYVFDGFGDAIQQASPDTGTTVYTYDADANLKSKTDAAGVVTYQNFDALDRVYSRTHPADSSQDVWIAYDQTGNNHGDGIGRMTTVADAAGYLAFGYDERGQVTFQRRTYSGTYYDVWVSYDAAGRQNGPSYPSGLWAGAIERDAAGNVAQSAAFPTGSGSYDVVAWTAHGPFGPVDYINYGNGMVGPIVRDYDYNISNMTLSTASSGGTTLQNVSYTFDADNNVTAITDAVNAADSQTLGYDVLDRVTSAASGSGGYGSLAWAYDKNGNLTSKTVGGTATTYALTSGSNRLASITQGGTTTITTNAVGNITSIPPPVGGSAATLSYNVENRLSSVSGGGATAATYVYGFDGHRVAKTVGGVTTLYVYGVNGELLEEKNLSTGAATDYIYVDGRPLGIFVPGGSGTLYFVHPDREGMPQFITNSSEAVVWSTTNQPYGTTGTITGSLTENNRFPGQYTDSETGFFQNWNRDYMPNLGRYAEADRFGLAGGMNPYAYANNNPLKYVDPSGNVGLLGLAIGTAGGAAAGYSAGGWKGGLIGAATGAAVGFFYNQFAAEAAATYMADTLGISTPVASAINTATIGGISGAAGTYVTNVVTGDSASVLFGGLIGAASPTLSGEGFFAGAGYYAESELAIFGFQTQIFNVMGSVGYSLHHGDPETSGSGQSCAFPQNPLFGNDFADAFTSFPIGG